MSRRVLALPRPRSRRQDNPTVTTPGLYVAGGRCRRSRRSGTCTSLAADIAAHTGSANLVPESKTASFHVGNKSKHLNGRQPVVPSGCCVGGGSSMCVNFFTHGTDRQ